MGVAGVLWAWLVHRQDGRHVVEESVCSDTVSMEQCVSPATSYSRQQQHQLLGTCSSSLFACVSSHDDAGEGLQGQSLSEAAVSQLSVCEEKRKITSGVL